MRQVKPRFKTIEDYLNYDDGTDTRYELADGELVEMPPENPINTTISSFLFAAFLSMGIPYYRLAIGHQIVVSSSKVTARQPDLIVHTEESFAAILSGGNLLMINMPPPMLVIEVVSGSDDKRSRDRDYVEKRTEYAMRGIPEYWLIDPAQNVVIVLALKGEEYREVGQFRGSVYPEGGTASQRIISPTFPELQLTAEQILKAGR
jgi:Uma2 family endonuclease